LGCRLQMAANGAMELFSTARFNLEVRVTTTSPTPTVPRTNSVPIDLGRLNRLTDGDPEFARDLAVTFEGSGNQQLVEIGTALATQDRGGIARAAHKLKGASANIYAQALADLAARLETAAPVEDFAQLQRVTDALRYEFNHTNEFLMASLPPQFKAASDA
jgi:HPt (histidine-containing phosphotransfer) domain-containing protein